MRLEPHMRARNGFVELNAKVLVVWDVCGDVDIPLAPLRCTLKPDMPLPSPSP